MRGTLWVQGEIMGRIFFRTIPRALNYLLLASATVLLAKVLVLNRIPEPLPGLSQLGLAVEGVIASIFASYVFYLLVVHYKEVKDKRLVYDYALRWARLIVADCETQLTEICRHTGRQAVSLSTLTQQDIEQAFATIAPHGKSPLALHNGMQVAGYADWIHYFDYYRERSKTNTEKILSQQIFLEAPLLALIVKIGDCSHFCQLPFIVKIRIGNTNLNSLSSQFYEYCIHCQSLDIYLKRHPYALPSELAH